MTAMASAPSSAAQDDAASFTAAVDDVSSLTDPKRCAWCGSGGLAPSARFCNQRCRQSAWRARKRASLSPGADDDPRRFAYADPPYPGFSGLYAGHPDFGGEVDHADLVASLTAGDYAGWALSTSSKTLREVLPLCPPEARVVAWVKPIGVSSRTYGMHSAWEPVIVVGGRQRRPGFRDWLSAQPAKLGGSRLIGRKPDAFAQFIFRCLGMQPGDILDDLFPGSGAVGRSWRAVGGTSGDRVWCPSLGALRDGPASSSTSATTVCRLSTNDAAVAEVHNDAPVVVRSGDDETSSGDVHDAPSLLQQRRLPVAQEVADAD